MIDSDRAARRREVEAHLEALCRLPYGSLFFDRTAALDFRLVEKEALELADALALLEEKLAAAAETVGAPAREPKGIGRLLDADPETRAALADLLERILPVLDHPSPADLAGRVPVAVDLHLNPSQAASIGLVRRRRIEASNN